MGRFFDDCIEWSLPAPSLVTRDLQGFFDRQACRGMLVVLVALLVPLRLVDAGDLRLHLARRLVADQHRQKPVDAKVVVVRQEVIHEDGRAILLIKVQCVLDPR